MFGRETILNKIPAGGGCTDILDNYDPFDDSSGLALYKFNGDSTDESGNYSFSTASNVSYPSGVFNESLDLLSNTSYVSGSGLTSTFPLTFSFWVKPDASANAVGLLINKRTTATNGYSITGTGTTNEMGFLNNGGYAGGGAGIANNLATNTWSHIVVIMNTSGWESYVNGSYYNKYSGTLNNTSNEIRLGKSSGIGNWVGSTWGLDQFRVFNRELTPLEIEALYTEEICICDGTVDTLDILGDGSCIATYPLDGNANDLSGNYSGTPTDVSYGVGEFDLAGVFNGSSSKISYTSPISSSNTDFSYSFWFKSNGFSSGYQTILGTDSDVAPIAKITMRYASTNSYKIYVERAYGSGIYYYSSSGSGYTTTTINPNTWYHLVFTYNSASSNNARIYINSSQTDSVNLNSLAGESISTSQAFGQWRNNNLQSFDGEIDQVRIFNKSLNSTEVTTLYNETACTYTPSACVDVFSDNSGISLYQLNGNAFDLDRRLDGAVTNVTWGGAGVFGTSANMKTLQGYIITPTAIYDNSFSGHSVSLWMYSGGTNYEAGIYTRTAAEAASGWHIRTSTSGNGINFSWQNSSGSVVFGSSELSYTFAFGWHHVVATWDGTTDTNGAKLYVDGSLLDQRTANETLASQTFTLGATLGGDRQSAGRSIQGLDQVRFFNRELTSTEVTTLYTSDASCG